MKFNYLIEGLGILCLSGLTVCAITFVLYGIWRFFYYLNSIAENLQTLVLEAENTTKQIKEINDQVDYLRWQSMLNNQGSNDEGQSEEND